MNAIRTAWAVSQFGAWDEQDTERYPDTKPTKRFRITNNATDAFTTVTASNAEEALSMRPSYWDTDSVWEERMDPTPSYGVKEI